MMAFNARYSFVMNFFDFLTWEIQFLLTQGLLIEIMTKIWEILKENFTN